MKLPQELNGYVFKTKASHLDGGRRLWSGMELDGLRHATLPKTHHLKMTTTTQSILARSSPGTRTAPSVAGHQDGGWKVCDWWTKIAMCQKQHHYRHLECEITESSRESWRTTTRNEEIPMEHPCTLWSTLEKLWKATSSFSVAVKTDMSMELDSSFIKTLWMELDSPFTKTLWMPLWDADQSLANSLPFVWRHNHLTSPSSTRMPQQLTTMIMTLKTSMISYKKS